MGSCVSELCWGSGGSLLPFFRAAVEGTCTILIIVMYKLLMKSTVTALYSRYSVEPLACFFSRYHRNNWGGGGH